MSPFKYGRASRVAEREQVREADRLLKTRLRFADTHEVARRLDDAYEEDRRRVEQRLASLPAPMDLGDDS